MHWVIESDTRLWGVNQLCTAVLLKTGRVWKLTAKRNGMTMTQSIGRGANVTERAGVLLSEWGCE